VPKLSDAVDITLRTSQARNLFNSMNKQVLRNRTIPIDIRRRLYQAIVVNLALWGSESWALKEETGRNWVSPQLSPQDAQVDHVRYSRETDHERTC
jgi:hypothetical protein